MLDRFLWLRFRISSSETRNIKVNNHFDSKPYYMLSVVSTNKKVSEF